MTSRNSKTLCSKIKKGGSKKPASLLTISLNDTLESKSIIAIRPNA